MLRLVTVCLLLLPGLGGAQSSQQGVGAPGPHGASGSPHTQDPPHFLRNQQAGHLTAETSSLEQRSNRVVRVRVNPNPDPQTWSRAPTEWLGLGLALALALTLTLWSSDLEQGSNRVVGVRTWSRAPTEWLGLGLALALALTLTLWSSDLEQGSNRVGLFVVAAVGTMALMVAVFCIYKRFYRRRQQYQHSPLQDHSELTLDPPENPPMMFLQGPLGDGRERQGGYGSLSATPSVISLPPSLPPPPRASPFPPPHRPPHPLRTISAKDLEKSFL
ncbi:unnamed protein product [Boreogadus saida]